MAFTNPMVVTIGGTAHSLKRINQDNNGSVYQKIATGLEIVLTVRHSYESKKADGSQIVRHNVDLSMTTYDVNGKADVTQAYVVARSVRGKDPVVATNILDALGVLVDAQSASIIDWEN
jgi:hypothetical protein